jgi:antiviral helicase SKI2
MNKLQLNHNTQSDEPDDWIDHIIDEPRFSKRVKLDNEQLIRELELKYLTPSSSFSTEWLNKLQQ